MIMARQQHHVCFLSSLLLLLLFISLLPPPPRLESVWLFGTTEGQKRGGGDSNWTLAVLDEALTKYPNREAKMRIQTNNRRGRGKWENKRDGESGRGRELWLNGHRWCLLDNYWYQVRQMCVIQSPGQKAATTTHRSDIYNLSSKNLCCVILRVRSHFKWFSSTTWPRSIWTLQARSVDIQD